MKMIERHDKGVAYSAQLLAIACYVDSTSASTAGSLDWPIVTLNNPVWLPIGEVNAIHGLIA
jgi:hypothetical protein